MGNYWKLSFDIIETHSRNRGPLDILSFGKVLVVLILTLTIWNKLPASLKTSVKTDSLTLSYLRLHRLCEFWFLHGFKFCGLKKKKILKHAQGERHIHSQYSMTSSDASGVRLAGDQVVLFLEIYTVKILPHSSATESIGKYKDMSLATSQMMILESSRTTGASINMG